ncbi:YciI family protein, partial [Klebsiella pneumoniae]
QRMAEYLVLYNSKRPHKSLELMTPVDYILRESKNCNMWWTHTFSFIHHRNMSGWRSHWIARAFRMSTIYVVVLTYIKPLEEVDRAIPAHIEWLKKGYADGLFLASGRRIPRTGGVILAKCDSRETLQARLSQDPFQQLGLARTEIIPFEASMASPALQSLL